MLRLPRFRFVRAATYADAARIRRDDPKAMLVAGGTDVYPNMKRRQYAPETLVALDRVQGARGIHRNGTVRIGAGTTLTQIAEDPYLSARYTALAAAAGLVSTPQLRNMGTLGGNLCLDTRCNWYDQSLFWRTAEGYCMKTHPEVVCRVATSSPRCLAVASADTVPALIALGASAVVTSADGERRVPLFECYREDGIRYLTLDRTEVVTAVELPIEDGWRSAYFKLRDRNSFDFPIVGLAAAVRLEGTTVRDARVAITAVASRPIAVEAAAKAIVGTRLEDEAIVAAADAVHKAARPMDNTSGTISQRKRASRVFAERALRALRDG
jgi:4-hydroxybenzoyl-CoA reductase subunit beta